MNSTFLDYLKILRPLNCAMAAAAVWIGASVAAFSFVFSDAIALAMAAAFLICGAGQVINDYFDFEIDKTKRKPRLSSKTAYAYYAGLLFIIGNSLAAQVNQTALFIAVVVSVLLIVYSAVLGRFKILGNIVVAAATALPLIFGASIVGDYTNIVWLALAAFFANWAREIIKDAQDISADEGKKLSAPMIFRAHVLDIWLLLLIVASAVFAAMPVLLETLGNSYYLLLVTIAIGFFVSGYQQFRKIQFASAQTQFKYGMLLALAGFAAAVL